MASLIPSRDWEVARPAVFTTANELAAVVLLGTPALSAATRIDLHLGRLTLNEEFFARGDTIVKADRVNESGAAEVDDVLGAIQGPRRLSKTHRQPNRSAFDRIVLLLQGGGALGAYQAGVYEALAEADLQPDWVAGISIGAINAAIIAGNAPNVRVGKLRQFWEGITSSWFSVRMNEWGWLLAYGDAARGSANQMSAFDVLMNGAPGFFQPRIPSPWFFPSGTVEATSYYDTAKLKTTLESLIDFDRLNAEPAHPRLSLGAVNVRSGNLVYFDSPSQVIKPEHVMASGALPPGFPAIEIDGEHYWDGGLVSNTPLQWIAMTQQRPPDSLVFQVDLWSAEGPFPRNLVEVATRQKEIQYSSRTRAFTDYFKRVAKLRSMIAALLEELPEEARQKAEAKFLSSAADRHAANIVQLTYRASGYEGDSKDYEFSRRTMEEHWRAGYRDAVYALRHPEIYELSSSRYERLLTFNFSRDGGGAP
jgi:NTE family protein